MALGVGGMVFLDTRYLVRGYASRIVLVRCFADNPTSGCSILAIHPSPSRRCAGGDRGRAEFASGIGVATPLKIALGINALWNKSGCSCSPHRNAGLIYGEVGPGFASLHPGYIETYRTNSRIALSSPASVSGYIRLPINWRIILIE
jgi:hypothetical protein